MIMGHICSPCRCLLDLVLTLSEASSALFFGLVFFLGGVVPLLCIGAFLGLRPHLKGPDLQHMLNICFLKIMLLQTA